MCLNQLTALTGAWEGKLLLKKFTFLWEYIIVLLQREIVLTSNNNNPDNSDAKSINSSAVFVHKLLFCLISSNNLAKLCSGRGQKVKWLSRLSLRGGLLFSTFICSLFISDPQVFGGTTKAPWRQQARGNYRKATHQKKKTSIAQQPLDRCKNPTVTWFLEL